MYLSIPESFYFEIKYVNAEDLNIEELMRLDFRANNVVIGVILPNQRENRWINDKEAIESEAEAKGATLKIEYSDFNIDKEVSSIKNLILEGIDALILTPVNQAGESEVIKEAKDKGIKVISYDMLAQNSNIDLYISFNITRIGEFQGEYLVKKVPKGNYITLSGEPSGDILKKGAMEYIMPLVYIGDIKIVADRKVFGWNPDFAFDIVKDSLIENDNKIDAILAPNDLIAGASINALQTEGLAGKVAVTGQDADLNAIRRIIEGTQTMTVLKDSRQLGKLAIDYAIRLANEEALIYYKVTYNGVMEVPTFLIDPIVIDRTNIFEVLNKTGYYKEYI